MKIVTFTRDMRPYRKGETYGVLDAVAEHVIAEGAAKARDADAPERKIAPEPILARAKPYITRKRR